MCAEYEVRTSQKHLEEVLARSLQNLSGQIDWDQRIKFTVPAPVIESRGGQLTLSSRIFPAAPFPNARLSGFGEADTGGDIQIRRVYDLPTWKQGFRTERLLAVMTDFFEPAYWGDHAGEVMRFRPHLRSPFFVAGIGLKPFKPPTGKRNGFALLTHRATEQMMGYHQRMLVILPPAAALQFLALDEQTPPIEVFNFLTEHRFDGTLDVTPERTMARGWEKRAAAHQAALVGERTYLEALNKENVRG